ncbi:cobalamin-independent methionine synthase II family protein [Erythrobacter sp.]|jgi:5-methyltetrahydropteroyltriglutamate--homocysteine methyltransferase|uniref:cobalamin-independent methionine synthase II family protein n=1 Tax=Erythrobacter sp. TaxID=1042 RepID=UPI002EBBAD2F|nr:cobalamin-independent methionine synthase II family protein [Erythrobacter sp.]
MIRTTHVGSLPRSKPVTDIIFAKERGERVDLKEADRILAQAVEACVAKQVKVGIDQVSDGEMSKISYATYISERISGFEGDSPRRAPADLEAFPKFLARQAERGGTPEYRRPCCVGEVGSVNLAPLEDDIQRFDEAKAKHGSPEGFMNAASPGVIALFQPNEYYHDEDAYLEAVAEAMRPEYEQIVDAGLMLQLDSPDLGLGRHMMFKNQEDSEYVRTVDRHVEVLNHALRNISAEKLRMHVCWGNYEGPHTHDVAMETILPSIMKAKPAALLFETSNPRHQHDYEAFADFAKYIPEDKMLIPGCIDTTTNFVEHPRVVANRIGQFVNIVGKDRVVAGTDCGFSTFAGFGTIDEDIVWAKLSSLVEGAAIASARV